MKPSEINAVIRELKKNRGDMLPKIKLPISTNIKDLSEVLCCSNLEKLDSNGDWDNSGWNGIAMDGVYSLHANYPEVPEVTEGWVVVTVDDKGYVWVAGRCYEWLSAPIHAKCEARRVSHFGGYLWESKRHPGRYTMSCDLLGFDTHRGLSSTVSQWVKPLTPKALRFWSTDVAEACTLGFKPWNADEWPKV